MIIGIGIDIIETERIKKAFERHEGRFKQKVYSIDEQEYCDKDVHSLQHYAARFTAKEAFTKAIGTGLRRGVALKDISVKNNISGKPELFLNGKAKEIYNQLGGQRIHLSLSHTEHYATAIVVIEGD